MSHVTHATDDHDSPLEERFSELYNIDDKPFSFPSLAFDLLPERARQFLSRNGLAISEFDPRSFTLEARNAFFHKLLEVRNAELSVFERNTLGVHREIVSQMSTLNTEPPGECMNPSDEEIMFHLRNVLIPEWRGHLDEGLEKIDALIWFEMMLTEGTPFEKPLETYLQDRQKDVEHMVAHATQSLQRIKEQIERDFVVESPSAQVQPDDGQTDDDCHSWTDVTAVSNESSSMGSAASSFEIVAPHGNNESFISSHDMITKFDTNYSITSSWKRSRVGVITRSSFSLFHSL